MHRNFGKFLLTLALFSLLPLWVTQAAETEAPGPALDPVAVGFENWILALERDTTENDVWEFPFRVSRTSTLEAEDFQTILLLRRIVQEGIENELESVVAQVERRQEPLPNQMLFWLAFCQKRLQRHEACLANLKQLLMVPDGWSDLDNGQRAWVLTGTPDLQFLEGERGAAEVFYRRLDSSSNAQVSLWANYQLAGLDFLGRSFGEASRRYGIVCEADQSETWREHACAMAEISGQLQQLRKDGEPDGHHADLIP
jgi:hypothetical protein